MLPPALPNSGCLRIRVISLTRSVSESMLVTVEPPSLVSGKIPPRLYHALMFAATFFILVRAYTLAPTPCLLTHAFTLPKTPSSCCRPVVMMFSTPEVPSASYFAPGSVITSILRIEEAGMALSTVERFELENIGSSFPLTSILKLADPCTLTFSSASTVTIGTFRSISSTLLLFAAGSSSML